VGQLAQALVSLIDRVLYGFFKRWQTSVYGFARSNPFAQTFQPLLQARQVTTHALFCKTHKLVEFLRNVYTPMDNEKGWLLFQ
jgi:hypothetical protein